MRRFDKLKVIKEANEKIEKQFLNGKSFLIEVEVDGTTLSEDKKEKIKFTDAEIFEAAKKELNINNAHYSLRKKLIINSREYKTSKSYLILIKKIGSFWDKLFGYGYFAIKLVFFLLFDYSKFKILFKAINHFILKKYGKFDLFIM